MVRFEAADPSTPEQDWLDSAVVASAASVDPLTFDALIVVAAHPDDETLSAGGLIARFGASARAVTVVLASDGEASHPDSPTTQPARLAELRRAEFARAMSILAPRARAIRLELSDGRLEQQERALTEALRSIVGEAEGSVLIVTPWLGDGHPDHSATARAATALVADGTGARTIEVWGAPIWAWHWGDPGSTEWPHAVRIELTPDEQDAKRRAGDAYTTQIAPLSPEPGDETLLSAEFLAHFDRSIELFFPETTLVPLSGLEGAAAP
ncbi:PIG-L deacetylase family protein [Naasia lichenicola]|uniref:PIG-L family deacetylase n=1 Tax=Naasia lichenicola TaxID=2565933 RepID=A0A4S4FI87_9MICO|nr:PIG-L deacetylase family protein [Naasia lichenicola]THG30030.1 PIG-L family deacetylase [Naasia lichenicola]